MAEWRKIVATNTIDAALLQKMFLAGAKNLEAKKEWINDLNVFPVPDGDTGTNMSMTMAAAMAELEKLAAEEPVVEVNCQFCDKKYNVDVNKLLKSLD